MFAWLKKQFEPIEEIKYVEQPRFVREDEYNDLLKRVKKLEYIVTELQMKTKYLPTRYSGDV